MSRVGRSGPAEIRRPVSLHDVAREAGVHSSTASRALTGATDRPVNPQTRDRVIAVAARLGYQPNAMARSLKTQSAGAIGMLVPSLRNPFWSQMMRAVVRRAWERELVVLVAEDTGDTATEQAYERLVAQARIDGLIVTSASADSSLPAARDGERGAVRLRRPRRGRQRPQRPAGRGARVGARRSSISPRSATAWSGT